MTPTEKVKRYWRIAFLLWISVVTIATHWPQTAAVDSMFESPDKLLHMVCFGMLAFMFMCSGWLHAMWAVWAVMALWVVVDEVTQHALPINRPFSLEDMIAGELGVASAMCWSGALQGSATTTIREAVEKVLAIARHWCLLGLVAILSTLMGSALLWFALYTTIGVQNSSFALFVGFVIAEMCVLITMMRLGNIHIQLTHLKKKLVPSLLGTMIIAAMLGFTLSHTTFDPWVVVLSTLAFGTRFAWNRATNSQEETHPA